MNFNQSLTAGQAAQILGAKLIGSADVLLSGANEIHHVRAGDISFVDHPKYYKTALSSAATIILINKEMEAPEGKALLLSDDPFRDFNRIMALGRPAIPLDTTGEPQLGEHVRLGKNVICGEDVIIADDVEIGHNTTIGSHVRIGAGTRIQANCVINDYTTIGVECTINAGTVIGTDALYYKRRPEGFDRLNSHGGVVIGDKVDIGGNCNIDRGATADTTIGDGTKIDALVHIGHDTKIGKHCLIAGNAILAGNVTLEDEVMVWGKVGISQNVKVGKGATIMSHARVTRDLEAGGTYAGLFAEEHRQHLRSMAALRKLPEVLKSLPK
ncbi:MAG: UDP-3-O-(3-hydroxymyristoyl)glucosamine N-acyltransferase [Bacteroidia bacterium]